MTHPTPLSPENRNFFSQVARLVFCNPFGPERDSIVSELAIPGTKPSGARQHPLTVVLPPLNQRIQKLDDKKQHTLEGFRDDDRHLLKHAYLLQVYLDIADQLDSLIEQQLNRGTAPIPVPFWKDTFDRLKKRGFSDRECSRYFALYYQLRRGAYFIDRFLVGHSDSMQALRLALWNNVFTSDVRTYDEHLWNRMEDFSTLLLGETGSGKGAAASAIGRSGFIPFDTKKGTFAHSFMESFVAVNLSQFPESLIESELFGHRKGAFTGAVDNHQGLFESCRPFGTLFLDEIGDASVPIQIKLLKVIQERLFNPVGDRKPRRFKGRVVAATNRSLRELRQQGNFRDDFFYRLCSDVITVPPLRTRLDESAGEMELLVDLILERMTGESQSALTPQVLEVLERDLPQHYTWPGNVRELEQAVRRILLNRSYKGDALLTETSLDDEFIHKLKAGQLPAKDILHHYCSLLHQRLGSYEEVARRTELDRRTVKKYIENN